jgi:hypothetical protein
MGTHADEGEMVRRSCTPQGFTRRGQVLEGGVACGQQRGQLTPGCDKLTWPGQHGVSRTTPLQGGREHGVVVAGGARRAAMQEALATTAPDVTFAQAMVRVRIPCVDTAHGRIQR